MANNEETIDLIQWREAIGRKIDKRDPFTNEAVPLTQSEAADLLGFEDYSSIGKVERGVANLNKRTITLARVYLNLSAKHIKNRLRQRIRK